MSDPPVLLFAYGTLMSDNVYRSVIERGGLTMPAHLERVPGLLRGYKRYCVKGAAYPGILPSRGSSVQGFLATVPASHLAVLDVFEGSDYGPRSVKIETSQGHTVQALVYEWIGSTTQLEDREWDFGSFVSDKEREWIRSGDDYFAAASRIITS